MDDTNPLIVDTADDFNNGSVQTSSHHYNPRLVNGIIVAVLMVIGVIGNSIVLYVQHFRCKVTTFSLFVKVLAAIDLVSCFLVMQTDIIIKSYYDLSKLNMHVICKIPHYFAYATAMSSGFVLLLIAVQRYRKICEPHEKAIAYNTAKILCGLSVALGAGISSLTLIVSGPNQIQLVYDDNSEINVTICRVEESMKGTPTSLSLTVILGGIFIAILIILAILYSLICRRLRLQRQMREKWESSSSDRPTRKPSVIRGDHVTKIFSTVTIVFVISYLPHIVLLAVGLVSGDRHRFGSLERKLHDLFYNFPYVNNVANPIIYSFLSRDFRNEFKHSFGIKANDPDVPTF